MALLNSEGEVREFRALLNVALEKKTHNQSIALSVIATFQAFFLFVCVLITETATQDF